MTINLLATNRGFITRLLKQNYNFRRYISNVNSPFQDDLSDIDLDDFGLGDFRHYKESPEVANYRRNQSKDSINDELPKSPAGPQIGQLESTATKNEPIIFISKLADPYLNLAIEDYVYSKIPISKTTPFKAHRLMFYTNAPCVVIGKNQNPWKEVNIPKMNQFGIPLIRRRSGGGTVVHDLGNVNYSFMGTKHEFDRFKFVNLIVEAVNKSNITSTKIKVNSRGDIVTQEGNGENGLKISGSAYKLSRGKSYHHGTMLLNSDLNRLKQVLHRDVTVLGIIDTTKTIDSVKAKVTNLQIPKEGFVDLVSNGFKFEYGISNASTTEIESENDDPNKEFNEMMGLTDFVQAVKLTNCFEINESVELPQEVYTIAEELKSWEWKFGRTPLFTHTLSNSKLGICVKLTVDKGLIVSVCWGGDSVGDSALLKELNEKLCGVQYRGDLVEQSLRGNNATRELGNWLHNSIDRV
ncbi:Aim22 protein [Candida orthopsilosis Co 90-125]|uniref:Putative lipoate-protein ligase A n=1 Tax=Candida orthopsilosis (strain 90-125) TaxID=1136231 RepID=H8X8H0_CANO9|nr:Aim22 protein [Candida orthopsilosis Co 90-125]CCG24445.1 Aim22 protein [Candida orthopsilosis Co 90-125]